MSPDILLPDILFEDANLIVVSKPAGLLSQGDHTGRPSLVDWAREHFGRPYVGLIHRLDTNTSGIMLIAKRTKAAERLTRALQNDQIRRTYVALLNGTLKVPARWEHYLVKNEKTNQVTAYAAGSGRIPVGAKLSALRVEPLAVGPGVSTWAQFVLETGRSHQIRAQAQASGYPLVGDPKYANESDPALALSLKLARPALHSWTLEFDHPIQSPAQPRLLFSAPLPDDLRAIPGSDQLRSPKND